MTSAEEGFHLPPPRPRIRNPCWFEKASLSATGRREALRGSASSFISASASCGRNKWRHT